MSKFLKECLLFLPLGILFLSMKPMVSYISGDYKLHQKHKWVYEVLNKAKSINDETEIVIIGDSVGNQIFNHSKHKGKINSFTCTSVIGLVGQYIFLTEFLENNSPSHVAILCSRAFFNNNLNRPEAYHHFLKPFYNSEYKPLLSDLAHKCLKNVPYKQASQLPHIITSTWGPEYEPAYLESKFLSDLSAEYLIKIDELCKENGIALHLLSVPYHKNNKSQIQKYALAEIKVQLADHPDLEQRMKGYINQISYHEPIEFKDGIHLKQPNKFKGKYIAQINEILNE